MRNNHIDIIQRFGIGEQVMVNRQLNLRADKHIALHIGEQVERRRHRALKSVFHRHHAVGGAARLHLIEHHLQRTAGQVGGRGAELARGGGVTECAGGAEISHGHRMFQRQTGADDFAIDAVNGLIGNFGLMIKRRRFGVARQYATDNRGLATGHVKRRIAAILLVFAHCRCQPGAFADQLQQGIVHRIDFRPECVEFRFQISHASTLAAAYASIHTLHEHASMFVA